MQLCGNNVSVTEGYLSLHCCRILDNLPLVVPIRRLDLDSSVVYLRGFPVGLKGQYAGVCTSLRVLTVTL